MNEFLKKKGTKVNEITVKIMGYNRDETIIECMAIIVGERVEQVEEFDCLG